MAASTGNAKAALFLKVKKEREDEPTRDEQQQSPVTDNSQPISPPIVTSKRKKRRLAGAPEEDVEVVALTPEEILAEYRFKCEICNIGHKREQNLRLHMRSHNKPTELIKRDPQANPPLRKVYVCPEPDCVFHDPTKALGDMTGIKKHYSRKHGKKQYNCPNCSRSYAIYGDLKAHSKICNVAPRFTYSCSCGAFFITEEELMAHRSSCDVYEGTTPASSPSTSDAPLASPRFVSSLKSSKEFSENAPPSYSLNNFASLNITSSSFSENTWSSSNTTSDTFTELPIHPSSSRISTSLNTHNAISESVRNVPSLDVPSFSTMPRSSLSTNDDRSFYCSKLQQSDIDDIYNDSDTVGIFSLSKEHPMLNYPIPFHHSFPNTPSSTYNFHHPSDTDNFKNQNEDLK